MSCLDEHRCGQPNAVKMRARNGEENPQNGIVLSPNESVPASRHGKHLFKFVHEKALSNNEEVGSAVEGYFDELDGSHYNKGIEALENQHVECL